MKRRGGWVVVEPLSDVKAVVSQVDRTDTGWLIRKCAQEKTTGVVHGVILSLVSEP